MKSENKLKNEFKRKYKKKKFIEKKINVMKSEEKVGIKLKIIKKF